MTFRSRLAMAATVAALVVVVLGAVAAYLVASNALVGSVDVNLSQTAGNTVFYRQITNGCSTQFGICTQVVDAAGRVLDTKILPVPPQAQVVAASQGRAADAYFSTTVDGIHLREVVRALSPGYYFQAANGGTALDQGGALQIATPLTGVDRELGHLALALWIIAIAGVAVAVMLGLAVGRTALAPLNSLTDSIEGLASSTDVTQRLDPGGPDELGRLRRAFNRLLAALDASRVSQRQLVLDASHELRTPLTSLRTNMEVARRLDELDPPERDVLIGDVLTQLDELTTLVGDLAELARGAVPALASGPVRFDSLVMEAVETATTHGRSRGVTFEAHVAPTWVVGSAPRIARAVHNLLDNALKWSPDGGVVEVTCAEATFTVRDHGPGVDDADMAHIFDRFYRAPAARGRPGSGLGLAIVAQVAVEEGGSVSVHHADGGGALFRLTLPVAAAPHPAGTGTGTDRGDPGDPGDPGEPPGPPGPGGHTDDRGR